MLPLVAALQIATPPDPLAYSAHLTLRCAWAHFDCDPKIFPPICVPFSSVRDCHRDCPNGADEECGVGRVLCDIGLKYHRCGQCVPVQEQNALWGHMCRDPQAIHCASTMNCVLPQWIQDGRDDCGDGSDEDPCNRGILNCGVTEPVDLSTPLPFENTTEPSTMANMTLPQPTMCELGEFRCSSGECINGTKVLDKKKDCEDGSDEDFCDRFGVECRVETRPCSYQPDIGAFGCGCPRAHTRTENGKCVPKVAK